MAWIVTAAVAGGVVSAVGSISAANTQASATRGATEQLKASEAQAREDLTPFRKSGVRDDANIDRLINDPQAQKDFITNNPFFTALADDAQRRIFQNKAAKGKVGSGGTAEALQNSILLLGNDLLSQDITRRERVATRGANAAARSATVAQNTGTNVANLTTQGANAQAAGIAGLSNAVTGTISNLVDLQAQKDPGVVDPTAGKVKI